MLGGGGRRRGGWELGWLRELRINGRLIVRRLTGHRVLPIILYVGCFCAVCTLLYIEVRDVLNVKGASDARQRRKSSLKSSSFSTEQSKDIPRSGKNTASDAHVVAIGGEEDASDSHQLKDVPGWVLEPAASGAGAPDPMEAIKVCLFSGKTLPECTEVYQSDKPASGVQGLQALLVKGMDIDVASAHAKVAAVLGQKINAEKHAASAKPCTIQAGGIKGSAVQVGELLRRSNMTTRALEASQAETRGLLLAMLSAQAKGADLCKSLWMEPIRDSRGYKMFQNGFSSRGSDRYIADELFQGKRGGFFVDIGSGDGLTPSNSLLLEFCYGWQGVCIEPRIQHDNFRPRCSPIHTAVSEKEGTAKLWKVSSPHSGLSVLESAVSNQHIDEIAAASDIFGAQKEELNVQAVHLPEILEKFGGGKEVDLLTISVGSGLLDALRASRVQSVRPIVIVADTWLCDAKDIADMDDLLTHEGYMKRKQLSSIVLYQRI